MLLLLLPPEPEEPLVEEAAGGSSVPLLTETGIIAGARVLSNGVEEKEEDTGKKNGQQYCLILLQGVVGSKFH